MLHAALHRPDRLPPEDRRAWLALLAETPAFAASPLLGPAFAELVGRVREDAHVAIFTRGGETVGVLAHHRRPGGLARPIGAPWSDRHALITAPGAGLDWREALTAADLSAFRFTALLDPYSIFGGAAVAAEEPAYTIAPADPGEAYWEQLRAGSPKRFKNIRRLEHKLDREHGPLELVIGDRSPGALSELMRWKREQFRRTGMHDVLHPRWSREMMERLFATTEGELSGLLIGLRGRGRLLAAHFGARAGGVYHPWLAAYDPAFAAWSPGLVLLSMAVRAMPEARLTRYELSGGSAHYKTVFASGEDSLSEGSAELRGAGPPLKRPVLVERVRRRLDHIAQTELTLSGRLQGVATALSDIKKRLPVTAAPKDSEA